MAIEIHRNGHPAINVGVATIPPFSPVKSAPTGTQDRGWVAVATSNETIEGFTAAKAAAPGEAFTAHLDTSVVKVRAGASIGVGAEVGIASSNGVMGPIAAASGVARHSGGKSQSSAAAGEYFSLLVRPRQLSGAA